MQRLKETRRHSGNGSPETQFGYFDGRAPMFDTVPDNKQIVEDDLTQELHSYQTMLADEKSRARIDPSTALHAARLEMEGLEQIKENVRDVRLGVAIETFSSELRQSLRSLSRNKDLRSFALRCSLWASAPALSSSASSTQPLLASALSRPRPPG
jgi:hypothetical protein